VLEQQALGFARRQVRLVVLHQVIEQQQRKVGAGELPVPVRAFEHRHVVHGEGERRIFTMGLASRAASVSALQMAQRRVVMADSSHDGR
jgi:hypothetical protein